MQLINNITINPFRFYLEFLFSQFILINLYFKNSNCCEKLYNRKYIKFFCYQINYLKLWRHSYHHDKLVKYIYQCHQLLQIQPLKKKHKDITKLIIVIIVILLPHLLAVFVYLLHFQLILDFIS